MKKNDIENVVIKPVDNGYILEYYGHPDESSWWKKKVNEKVFTSKYDLVTFLDSKDFV